MKQNHKTKPPIKQTMETKHKTKPIMELMAIKIKLNFKKKWIIQDLNSINYLTKLTKKLQDTLNKKIAQTKNQQP